MLCCEAPPWSPPLPRLRALPGGQLDGFPARVESLATTRPIAFAVSRFPDELRLRTLEAERASRLDMQIRRRAGTLLEAKRTRGRLLARYQVVPVLAESRGGCNENQELRDRAGRGCAVWVGCDGLDARCDQDRGGGATHRSARQTGPGSRQRGEACRGGVERAARR